MLAEGLAGASPPCAREEQTPCDGLDFQLSPVCTGVRFCGGRNNAVLPVVNGQLAEVFVKWTKVSVKSQWLFDSVGDTEKAAMKR